jgi:type I restriction enzyme R subunit
MLDQVRKHLRDLVKFIDKKGHKIIYTDFQDEIGDLTEFELSGLPTANDLAQYKKKVTAFIRSHENHITINKLNHNLPITASDIAELERLLFEAGGPGRSREDFERAFGPDNSLGVFVRSLVGLDRESAIQAFGKYLDGRTLNTAQIRFIDLVIDYLTQNGIMDPALLYTPPYTDLNPSGLDGVFTDSDADRILNILKRIRENAAA